MSNIKNTVDKIKNLEAEKLSLMAEVEELKRMADAKANALVTEISALKEEINLLKILMEQEQLQAPRQEHLKEKNLFYVKELAEKTTDASNQLGNQVFPSSPFSQHFDNWLADLRRVISDFESNSSLAVDEQFVKDCSEILLNVEEALNQKRVEESKIGAVAKALADNNHLLVETDKEYAEKARELSLNRDVEVERLTDRVRDLEHEVLSQVEDNEKRKILKKKTEDKLPQTREKLKSAKNELEAAQRNFIAEQENLHESYEKEKQDITEQVEGLRKELERLQIDASREARQAAGKALADAVNALVKRTSIS
jgi:hypothetical protein